MDILFFSPDYLNIYKQIEKEMVLQNHNVDTILFDNYSYENNLKKVVASFLRLIKIKKVKKKWASLYYANKVNPIKEYDLVFIISPDYLFDSELKRITSQAIKSVVFYWDSFKFIGKYERTLHYFDKKYSFEPEDVKKYNLELLTNFYYDTKKSQQTIFDAYFIGQHDNRINTIEKITERFIAKDLKTNIIIRTNKNIKKKNSSINYSNEEIPFEKNIENIKNAKIILDIQKPEQNGLTFRVFEAIGLEKKLITTNKDIVNYDFYNPNNIFVWDNITTEIPNDFLTTPYQPLSIPIFEKYSIKKWVKTILN